MKKIYILFFLFFLYLCIEPLYGDGFKNWFNTNYVTDMTAVGDNIFIGSTKGFIIFTPFDSSFIILNRIDGLLEDNVNGLAADSSYIYLFAPSGITILSVDTTRLKNISTSFSNIEGEPLTGLLRGDSLLLGTTQYLYIWDTDGEPFYTSWNAQSYNFRNYRINTIFCKNDTFYFGTDGGICCVPHSSFSDTTEWIWNGQTEGLPCDTVTSVVFHNGALWIGTENGIASGDMNNWILRNTGLLSRKIKRLFSGEMLWSATDNFPHYWVDSLSEWVSVEQGLGIRRIRGICSDTNGRVWIGIDGDGIAFLDDTLWNTIRLPGPSSSNFSDISIDKNGDIWGVHYGGFVSEKRGKTISHFCKGSGEWEVLNDTNELAIPGAIRWVDVDNNNNKWFGIWHLGTNKDIIKLSENGEWDSLSLPVSGVVGSQFIDSKGNKWFSSFSSSVCKLLPDDSTWRVYTDENYLNYIAAFAEDNSGNIYFGSAQKGLTVLRTDSSWLRIGGLPSEAVFDLAFDKNGDLWVGTAGGIAVVRNFVTINQYQSSSSGLLGDDIMDIYVDWKGNRWFLVGNKGVSVLLYNNIWDSLTTGDGLASNLIIDDLDGLAFDIEKGYLWIATKDGISRYETGVVADSVEIDNIGVYPNPFIPQKHHLITFSRVPDDARIYIYSISLKRLKTIKNVEESTHRAFWDGKDENGKSVDSGIYIFLVVEPSGNKKSGKIAVIR